MADSEHAGGVEIGSTAGAERYWVAEMRDRAAERRDHAAELRDEASEGRDRAAELRDEAAQERDRTAEDRVHSAGADDATEILDEWALFRREAAFDRDRAGQDRGGGAKDRAEAGLDRDHAAADRGASATDREYASVDGLTGVYIRDAGLVELEREIARAGRTRQPLVLAFVDVDQLKAVNDARGHAAGDRLLLQVAKTLKAALRPYDLIIRYGGDEFVCAIPGMDLQTAATRFMFINALLAQAPEHGSVTVGLAELQSHDESRTLIARADEDLYRERERRTGS